MPSLNADRLWAQGQGYYSRHLAYAALDRFQGLARSAGADLSRAYNAAGLAAMRLGDHDAARSYLERSLQEARAAGPARPILRTLINLMVLFTQMSDGARTLRCAAAAEPLYDQVGDPRMRCLGLMYTAMGRELVQDWASALDLTRRAMAIPDRTGDTEAWLHNNLGLYLRETGHTAGAGEALRTAVQLGHTHDQPEVVAYASTELARLCASFSDWEGVFGHGRTAVEFLLNRMLDVEKGEVARLSEVFGRLALAMDERRRGTAMLERATAYYAQLDLWQEWSRVSELLRSGGVGRLTEPARLPPGTMETATYFSDLFGLLDNIEGTDPRLASRAGRVTHYALLLASALGVGQEQVPVISHAGRLCDIGLTTFSMEEIADEQGFRYQMHPDLSARWLEDFPLPDGTVAAVRTHHERFDGTGFPAGLSGEAIPYPARLLAVSEAYVLRMERGFGHDEAMAALARERGRGLDPTLVDGFLQMHRLEE